MNRKLVALLAVVLAVPLFGCIKPDGDNIESVCVGTPAAIPVDKLTIGYLLNVTTIGDECPNSYVERYITCDITGIGPNQEPVYILDSETGQEAVYDIQIAFKSPKTVEIVAAPGIVRITYTCSMTGRRNDAMFCEVETYSGISVAPANSLDIDEIDTVSGMAFCYGTIIHAV